MTETTYDGPVDTDAPVTGLGHLQVQAVVLHEYFVSLVSAGFTEDQALAFLVKMVKE